MENLLIQLSRYIIVFVMAIYTLFCFTAFRSKVKERQNRTFRRQRFLLFVIHLICSFILYINSYNSKILFMYAIQVVLMFLTIQIYQLVYKGLSRLVLNNMLMFLVVGFVMLERIHYDNAVRQYFMVVISVVLCVGIPFIIEKFPYFDRLGWQYALVGIVCLMLVYAVGIEIHGATNWVSIGGYNFQPSEFVKIIFVFFIAAFLSKSVQFKNVVKVSFLAGVHVLILVAEKDLGGALIFFITFLVMLFVATRQPLYLFGGLLFASLAATVGYHLFSHVQVRVIAWKNPWEVIDGGGYQITQSLFAISTGGWFGMGIGKGLPNTIPVVASDFIFSAIIEEMGGLFAICLVLVYLSCFIMFINIAMKMKKNFFKLTALGLSIMYVFQVFLTIGGVTKFIPSTGVTLPLISYGGSSVLSTVILFSVIQGMYVLNENEGKISEKNERRRQSKRIRTDKKLAKKVRKGENES